MEAADNGSREGSSGELLSDGKGPRGRWGSLEENVSPVVCFCLWCFLLSHAACSYAVPNQSTKRRMRHRGHESGHTLEHRVLQW